MKKYNFLICVGIVIICIMFCISCKKTTYYRFTEEELNFLSYQIGDSVNVLYSEDTFLLEVIKCEYSETDGGSYGEYIYDVKDIVFTDALHTYDIYYSQNKNNNNFEAHIIFGFKDYYSSYSYSYDSSDYIQYLDSFEINSVSYVDVIKLTNPDNLSNLYLNMKGFIYMETEFDNYLFK